MALIRLNLLVWLLASGIVLLPLVYYKFSMSLNAFISLEITLILAIITLLILRLNRQTISATFFGPRLTLSLVTTLSISMFISAYMEMTLIGHLSMFSLLVMLIGFTIAAVGRGKPIYRITLAMAAIGTLSVALYGSYTPSFGNDTWRDIMIAEQLLLRGRIEALTARHDAYPIPVVPLLYATASFATGTDPLWTSAIVGLVYLFLLPLSVYTLSRRILGDLPTTSYSAILISVTPLAVIWSFGFIPQAYSLTLGILAFLSLLAGGKKAEKAFPFILLSTSLVLGHGGVATFFLLLMIWLILWGRSEDASASLGRYIWPYLIPYSMLFIMYFVYTTLVYPLISGYTSVIEAIKAFLSGQKILVATSPYAQQPVVAVLSYIPISVIVTSSLTLLVDENTPRWMKLTIFLLLVMLAIALIGSQAFPALDALRYLGFPSTTFLAIFASLGLSRIAERKTPGLIYFIALLLLATTSFVFSGAIMPDNPFTASPYAGPSIYGLITYSEAQNLKYISYNLINMNILTDWRSGAYMSYTLVKDNYDPHWIGHGNRFTRNYIEILYAGSYGYVVTPHELINKLQQGYMFLVRGNGLEMPESFYNINSKFIDFIYLNYNIIYNSNNIIII
ncbi:hypothetical protein [Pyrobaculum sp.]|uniref:hypothetical protein n=1 Tax=Pyrobaculum sp. TaxID=2004705 RepID=UPI0031823090